MDPRLKWSNQCKNNDDTLDNSIMNSVASFQAEQAWICYWWHYRASMAYHVWSRYYRYYIQETESDLPSTCPNRNYDTDPSSGQSQARINKKRSNCTRATSCFKSNNLKRSRVGYQGTHETKEVHGEESCKRVNSCSDKSLEMCQRTDDSHEQNEDNELEIELNDEFREFLEISEQHRRERAERKKVQEEKKSKSKNKYCECDNHEENEYLIEYVDASEQHLITTTDAPNNSDMQREAKKMYGHGHEKILTLEAEMQLHFNEFCDANKPAYWPNIPLRL